MKCCIQLSDTNSTLWDLSHLVEPGGSNQVRHIAVMLCDTGMAH